MGNLNITTKDDNIVCKETSIKLSDEKLKNVLSKAYETARKDARKLKWYKHYGVLLSIAFTLIVTLFTAEFKSFWIFDGECLKIVFAIISAICLIVGLIMLITYATLKDNTLMDERDIAIENIIATLPPRED